MSAEESALAFNNRCNHAVDSATEAKLYDRSSQLSDADIPSSITVPESWDDNPFPSLTDSSTTEDALEPQCSANQHQKGRSFPFGRELNVLSTCTQSSATQIDSDDDDPFPMLPLSAEKSARDFTSQRLFASPRRRGKTEDDVPRETEKGSPIMPDIGSFDDAFSMSVLKPRNVAALLRSTNILDPTNGTSHPADCGVAQQTQYAVKAFLSIFENSSED